MGLGHVYEGKWVLGRVAKETGARIFEVSRDESLAEIYASIGEELRNKYSLGYSPDVSGADRKFREIKVVSTRKDLKVQTREGYYPR